MGQAQNPVSSITQQLNESKSATADANGNATFSFDSPPTGLVWTGTVSCAGAPSTAVFLAKIGATTWGDWGGNSVGGPVQAFPNQQLVVTATGLTPNTPFLLVWAGSSDAETTVQPVFPDPSSSALSVALASTQGIVDSIGNSTSQSFTGGLPTAIVSGTASHSYSCIIVAFEGTVASAGATLTAEVISDHASFGNTIPWPPQIATLVPNAGYGTDCTACFLLPVALAPGDTFSVTITASRGLGSIVWQVFGVTTSPAVQVTTAPSFPLATAPRGGVLTVKTILASATSAVMLAAPAAGTAYRLHRIVDTFGAAGTATVQGTTSGFNFSIIVNTATVLGENLNGQVVTEGVTFATSSAAGATGFLTYDLIPLPTVQ